MATHKSAWKRYLQSEKRRLRNRTARSGLKTQVKKARAEIESGKSSPVAGEVKNAVAAIHAAASKGVLHKRTAARRVSRLMKAASKKVEPKAAVVRKVKKVETKVRRTEKAADKT